MCEKAFHRSLTLFKAQLISYSSVHSANRKSSYTRFLHCKTLLFALKKNSDLKKISFYIFQADTLFILRGIIYFILIVINFKDTSLKEF